MGRFLRERISRRQFLGAAVGTVLAGAAALRGRRGIADRPRGAVRVLLHDAVQDGGAFSQGRLVGARLAGVGRQALRGAGTFESAVIASPFPFTHAGLHWKGEGEELGDAVFEVRTSEDGVRWSRWLPLYVEALPLETPAGETYAALVGAPRARYLQYRARLPDAISLASVTTTFINSVDGPIIGAARRAGGAQATPEATPEATPQATPEAGPEGKPIDFSREDWGADESLRFRGEEERWPRAYVPVKKLVIHHTATSNDYTDGAAEVRAIYAYHARTRGWGDIGYNALVDRFGNSYEGRYGRENDEYGVDYGPAGREVLSQDVVAGHTLSHNYGTLGVALIGNFQEAEPPADGLMTARLLDILAWEATVRQMDPLGSSDYLLQDDSWHQAMPNVSGHRDSQATACPGEHAYELLPSLREALAERLAQPDTPGMALVAGPNGVTESLGQLTYAWQDPTERAVEYSYYLEGWSRPAGGLSVDYLSGFTPDRRPAWSDWTRETSAAFAALSSGQYTFHVRSRDAEGRLSTYEDNRTILEDRREEMPTEQDLRNLQVAAGIFLAIAAYVLNGQEVPGILRDQARFLLRDGSEPPTGDTQGRLRS